MCPAFAAVCVHGPVGVLSLHVQAVLVNVRLLFHGLMSCFMSDSLPTLQKSSLSFL